METLTDEEARNVLREGEYGHLALCKDGQAYVIPMCYGYAGQALYFHGTGGLKAEFAEATERACFSVGWIKSLDEWVNVLAYGALERIEEERERLVAMDALLERPNPPVWGTTDAGEPARADEPEVYYKLAIDEVTGRVSERQAMGYEERVEFIGA